MTEKGKYTLYILLKEKEEIRNQKSASKRLVKLDELANNFAIKREQSQTCLNYAEQ